MAKQGSDASSVELSHYLTVLRRRWKFVVAGVALGVALGSSLVLVLPPSSTAATQVNVNLISSNAFNSQRPASDLIDMQTEQSMARSTAVMSAVAQELGSEWTHSSVRAATTASLLPDGTVLRIEFTAPNAEDAANGAALVAEEYLAYRSDLAQDRVDVASQRLTVRRNTLNRQLARANTRVSQATQGAERNSEEMSRQAIADELGSVTSQINELRAVDTSGGTVIIEADPAQVQVSPNRPLVLGSGILGGMLLGLVLAFVANVLDRRVRDSYDVYGAGGGIVVARLQGAVPSLPAVDEDAESLRAVRERLLSSVPEPRPVMSVIDVGSSSALPSDVAANLAVALADSGMTTDLVLAGHSKEVLDEILAALQVNEVESVGAARRFRGGFDSSLTVLVPQQGHQRLSTADIVSDLLADGVRTAEATVVGVAQTAGPAVRLSAGRASHQVVLVVEEMTTRIDDLAQVATDLIAVHAEIRGTVLVPKGRHLPGLSGDAPRRPPAPPAPAAPAVMDAPVGRRAEEGAAAAADARPPAEESALPVVLPQRTAPDPEVWQQVRQALDQVVERPSGEATRDEEWVEDEHGVAHDSSGDDVADDVAADVADDVADVPADVAADDAADVPADVAADDVADVPDDVEVEHVDVDVDVDMNVDMDVDMAHGEEGEEGEEGAVDPDAQADVEQGASEEVIEEHAEPDQDVPEDAASEADASGRTVTPPSPFDVIDTSVPMDVPVVANEESWAFNR